MGTHPYTHNKKMKKGCVAHLRVGHTRTAARHDHHFIWTCYVAVPHGNCGRQGDGCSHTEAREVGCAVSLGQHRSRVE
jgi:hypothetical protein